MAKILSFIFWNTLSIILFILVCYQLKKLSQKVSFHQVQPERALESKVQLDFCYLMDLKENEKSFEKPEISDCNFSRPISSFGKLLKNRTAKYIIEQFKKCKLDNLIRLDNLTKIKKIDQNATYELHADHICVKYQFEIDTSLDQTELMIVPVKNNQTFLILASFVRTFQNDGEYRSIKRYIFKRTCKNNQSKYHCNEVNQKYELALFYTRIECLKSPFDFNCVERVNENQNDCYENCVKTKKKHISLTYNDKDNFTLNFDELKVIEPLIDQCVTACNQVDCKSGNFGLDKIFRNENASSLILLKIIEEDAKSKAFPYYSKMKLTWLLITYFGLIFRINLVNQMANLMNLYNYVELKNQRIERKSKSPILLLIVGLICFAISIGFEKLAFKSNEENTLVTQKFESLKEQNLSVSICFDFCEIIKNKSIDKATCDQEMLKNMNLTELEKELWNVSDFKMNVRMQNSVRILYLKEMKVHVFYRLFKKCFLVFYESKNYYPQISLQRKFEIFFSLQPKFSYFLEAQFHYPKIDSKSANLSYLNRLTEIKLKGINCTDYSKPSKNRSCSSKDDCQQECVLDDYVKMENHLPIFVNLKIDQFSKYSTLKFSNNKEIYEKILEKCKTKINKDDCNSSKLTFRSIFNLPKYRKPDSNLSINLTPLKNLKTYLPEENNLIVLNRIISLTLFLSGFSMLSLFKRVLSKYCSSRMCFVNYEYLKKFCYFINCLMFLVHFILVSKNLMFEEMDSFSYRFYSNSIILPKVHICYEIDFDLSTNNYTISMLNNMTLKSVDIFEKVTVLDEEHNLNETELTNYYVDNSKCFSLTKKHLAPVQAKHFTLDKSVKIYLNLNKIKDQSFFLFASDPTLFVFDWYKTFNDKYYLIYFSINIYHYQDDYWHLKNLHLNINYWLGIEENKNSQKKYNNYSKRLFNRQQRATTTSVPLYPEDEDLIIQNDKFQNFIYFRSLEGKKNEYDFTQNTKRYHFDYDYSNHKIDDLKNKSVISFIPNFTHWEIETTNKYQLIEFFLHLFVLFAFWFKISVVHLTKSLKNAFKIGRFFMICFLYFVVSFLIVILMILFKFFEFMKFRLS